MPLLITDGRERTWRELGRMLMTIAGWQSKLMVADKSGRRKWKTCAIIEAEGAPSIAGTESGSEWRQRSNGVLDS